MEKFENAVTAKSGNATAKQVKIHSMVSTC